MLKEKWHTVSTPAHRIGIGHAVVSSSSSARPCKHAVGLHQEEEAGEWKGNEKRCECVRLAENGMRMEKKGRQI